MVGPQKQATSGLQKEMRVPPMQTTFCSKQNGRTVPSESERSIEKMPRVPSMQTVVFCCAPATQYAADAKAVKKMASIPSIQMTVLHNASATQYTASQKAAWKKRREFRACMMCSMQLTPELSQQNGERSVHAKRDFSYLRRPTLRLISISQRKHKA